MTLRNTRDNRTLRVPEGIDPGFGYNPCKQRGQGTAGLVAQRLERLPLEAATQAVRAQIEAQGFADFYAKPPKDAEFPVAMLDPAQAERLGAKSHVVILSADTAVKQLHNHPDIAAADYVWVQRALLAGEEIADGERAAVYVLDHDGWVVVVQATRSGAAVFLKSFRRMSSDEAERGA